MKGYANVAPVSLGGGKAGPMLGKGLLLGVQFQLEVV